MSTERTRGIDAMGKRGRAAWLVRWGVSVPAGIVLWIGLAAATELGAEIAITILPPNPTTTDAITIRLSGTWNNGCVPRNPQVSIVGEELRIDTSNPSAMCTQALTDWKLSARVGPLPAGTYRVIVTYSSPSVTKTVNIGTKLLRVGPSSP